MRDFTGQSITVVGAGMTGIALCRYFAARGARVTLSDRRPQEEIALPEDLSVATDFGGHSLPCFTAVDRVVVSPGVPLSIPPLEAARAAGVPVTGELDVALAELTAPVIGVTGTNGKSTTTSLLGAIYQAWDKRVFVGGNLGTPLIDAVGQDWDALVVELSSFQLDGTEALHPAFGLLLNITPDHLDRYPDMEAYAASKGRLFRHMESQDIAVVNLDDPLVMAQVATCRCGVVGFSCTRLPEEGMGLAGEELVWRHQGQETRFPLASLQLQGCHNQQNVMAALLPPLLAGCPPLLAWEAVCTFTGLPHRMQLVRRLNDVAYIDDSKGTNVGSVLQSLAGLKAPVTLIAGGSDKGSDFSPLRAALGDKVTELVLLGATADKIAAAVAGCCRIHRVGSMEEAVTMARALTPAGGTVLLSPGCASFDMFRNYAHRGEVFAAAVQALPEVRP